MKRIPNKKKLSETNNEAESQTTSTRMKIASVYQTQNQLVSMKPDFAIKSHPIYATTSYAHFET